jgi:hypothetical protein
LIICRRNQNEIQSSSLQSWLAARQGLPELAARLFSSRWYRGNFNSLAPSEHSARIAIESEFQNLLGEERFAQLSQEGQALNFIQVLAIVQEF